MDWLGVPQVRKNFGPMNFFERASQLISGAKTLTDWLGAGGMPVGNELAQSRADVCLKCPMNVKDWDMIESIADAIKKQVELKNHLNLRVDGEKSLHICSACGCVMRLKVHVPLRLCLPEANERDKYHPSCWILSESKI